MPFLPQCQVRNFRLISLLFISIFAVAAVAACGSEPEPPDVLAEAASNLNRYRFPVRHFGPATGDAGRTGSGPAG